MTLSIYYDGHCRLCSPEIDYYRVLDQNKKKFVFIDISSAEFNASRHGLDSKRVQKIFHVKTSKGKVITGVDAFAEIWKELGIFNIGRFLIRYQPSRFFMQLGYLIFANIRPFLPKKKSCTRKTYSSNKENKS